jgi:hypothetical protein
MAGAFIDGRFHHYNGLFCRFNPKKNTLPIINFLNQDQHDQWRFTAGFWRSNGYFIVSNKGTHSTAITILQKLLN